MAKGRLKVAGVTIKAGETRDLRLKISETYTGDDIDLPIRVIRAKRPGPRLLLAGAVHGDEINGTGIIREIMLSEALDLKKGALICLPVVNVFGFERRERYMPDRRDLNRMFPGAPDGSLASRVAHTIFTEIVPACDHCIDLHSASKQRTNFANIRADLSTPGVAELAEAFGVELIVNSKGPEGSFRRTACEAGCPTIILEIGEVAKIEPAVVGVGVRGVKNLLKHLGMLPGEPTRPAYQTIIKRTTWVRAGVGGLLRFHVAPGDVVKGGQAIATNESIFGDAQSVLISPVDGVVLGMTTLPAVKPGEPVCHIAEPELDLAEIEAAIEQTKGGAERRLRRELATNISVTSDPDRRNVSR